MLSHINKNLGASFLFLCHFATNLGKILTRSFQNARVIFLSLCFLLGLFEEILRVNGTSSQCLLVKFGA